MAVPKKKKSKSKKKIKLTSSFLKNYSFGRCTSCLSHKMHKLICFKCKNKKLI